MNQQAKAKALSLAYEFVTNQCGLNQKLLVERLALNKRTLTRIRLGLLVRDETFNYAMSALYRMIDDAYMNDLSVNGGARSAAFNKLNKDILRILLL